MAAPLVVMGGGNAPTPSSAGGGAPPNAMNGGGANNNANAAASNNAAGECVPPGGGGQQQQQQQPLRFEDLTIDDELPLLDRIARYCKSNIALQRLVHVKMLASTAEASGRDATAERILPLLPALAKDPESIIRQHVAVQLLPLAFACVGYRPDAAEGSGPSSSPNGSGSGGAGERGTDPASYGMLIDGVLPHLSALASDPDQDVRAAAGASIAGICHHRVLRDDDVGPLILPIPVGLSHTEPPRGGMEEDRERAADLRITAAALLGDLAASLGPDLVRHFVTSEIISLAQDPVFRVRRVVANHSLPKVCAVADADDISHRLFPVYVKLSMDDSYRVRKACADSLVELARIPALPAQLRSVELVQMWKRLKGDAHKSVRQSAFQNLGLLIATFAPPDLVEKNSPPSSSSSGAALKTDPARNDGRRDEAAGDPSSTGESQPKKAATAAVDPVVHDLVPHFVSMASMDTGEAQQDAEMRLHCAYSLPAVALTVGPDGWVSLSDAFAQLAGGAEDGGGGGGGANGNSNVMVRRCVACSLHEIAGIVGDVDGVVERELRPAFERFLRDPSEDVRIGALRNLHRFVAVVPSGKGRTAFLSAVEEMLSSSSPMNWRIRNHVARQLVHLIGLFEANTVRMKMSPLLFGLLNDPVAEVRDNTYGAVSSLLKSFFWVNVARDEVPENFADEAAVRDWSSRAVQEILSNIKRLASSEDFSHRQSFCQICARLANSLASDGAGCVSTPDEVEYLTGLLVQELLPLALIMRDDDVANVRLTLGKALRGMPGSIRERPEVTVAVNDLDNEEGTWEEIPNNNGKSITFQKSRSRGQSDRDQKRTPSRRSDKASRAAASADGGKASEKPDGASSRKQPQKGGVKEVDGIAPAIPPELDGGSKAKPRPAAKDENDKADARRATANGIDAVQGDEGALTTSGNPEGDGDSTHQSTPKKVSADKQHRESDDEEQSLASI